MKKLLLVLMVIALAAFLLVGCTTGTTPDDNDGGDGVVEICPTISVDLQQEVLGTKYIKGGEHTITVTFAVPTEIVSVYVGKPCNEKALPVGVPDASAEVMMHTTDSKTYTGTYTFTGECCESYIYVVTCTTCAPCKEAYTVDSVKPYATPIEICSDNCICAGCNISFTSTTTVECDTTVNCGDDCSGLASWAINIYDTYPFGDCCDASCEPPIDGGSGTACPVSWTTTEECFDSGDTVYAIFTLVDNVGNDTKFGYAITKDADSCDHIPATPLPWVEDCLDTAAVVVYCDDIAD